MDHQSTQLLTLPEPVAFVPDVELVGITKRYGAVAAVDAIDLEVHPGEFLSLLGPSGCGKTTTLRLIAGFERPDEGEVRIGGRDVSLVPPYKRDVNTVFQSYALFPHLSVMDNVAYGLKQRGLGRSERRTRATEMLELVRLPAFSERKPMSTRPASIFMPTRILPDMIACGFNSAAGRIVATSKAGVCAPRLPNTSAEMANTRFNIIK